MENLIPIMLGLVILALTFMYIRTESKKRFYRRNYINQKSAYVQLSETTSNILEELNDCRDKSSWAKQKLDKRFVPIDISVVPETKNTIFVADNPNNDLPLKNGTVHIKLVHGKIVSCYKSKRQEGQYKKVPVFIKVFK